MAFGTAFKKQRAGGKDKGWRVRFRWDGRRLDRAAGSTKGQAERILRRLEDCKADGLSLTEALCRTFGEGRTTSPVWEDACEQYLASELDRRKPGGRASLKSLVGMVSKAPFARMPIDQVRRRDIRLFLDGMTDVGPATKNRRLSTVRLIFKWAQQYDYIEASPCLGLNWTREPVARETRLSLAQAGAFLRAAPEVGGEDFGVAVALSLLTGLRLSNVLGMEWRWLFNGRLQVPRTESKSGAPIVVQVSPTLDRILSAHRESQQGIGLYLFPALKQGKAGSATRSQRWYRSRFDKTLAAVPGAPAELTIHDLRRTAASLALEAGASLEEIGDFLGHASHYVTARYAHVAEQDKGAAALRIAL